MKKKEKNILIPKAIIVPQDPTELAQTVAKGRAFEQLTKPTAEFTRALASEIVKNLSNFGQMTTRPFRREKTEKKELLDEQSVYIDTSVLIDGRILPVVNSGFLTGNLIIPQFILAEVQHIADSADSVRRSKGRRGLDVANRLKDQKGNALAKVRVSSEDPVEVKEADHKLVALAKKHKSRLLTVDFNLAQMARAQGVKILNINDLAQALKLSIVTGEEINIKITHEGKERQQGVGYLEDGTMVVVDDTRDKVGSEVTAVITKIHQTPAGQLFFGKLR